LALKEDAALATPRRLLPDAVAQEIQAVGTQTAVRNAAMLTMGSTSLRMFERPCREAAARARMLLQQAAGERWGVDWHETDVRAGFVIMGQKKLRFGELAAEAAKLTPKGEAEFRGGDAEALYGRSVPRLDSPAKLDGSANFAGDVRLPDMVYAAIRQGPLGDSTLISVAKSPPKIPGLLKIVRAKHFVATVATNWWAANQALDRLAPRFLTIGAPSSADIETRLKSALKTGDGTQIIGKGDVSAAFSGQKLVQADYSVAPALHAPVETRTATARISNGPGGTMAEIWVATQAPAQCRAAIAAAIGFAADNVILYPMPAGGSFDIALEHAAACQAAIIAKSAERPVQLIWSRTEEILRDVPRSPVRARMVATLDGAGRIHALNTRIAAPAGRIAANARLFDGASMADAQNTAVGKSDAAMVQGAETPYAIPHLSVDHFSTDIQLPVGRWRGNADSYTAFFTECFIDEMAMRANQDPLSYRILMLGNNARMARCLTTATMMGGWEGGIAGSGQGIACHSMRNSHIGIMVQAGISERGIRVDQIFAAVDVGRLVHPDIARQQIEGGLIFGLAAAVGATTRYKAGVAGARKLGQLNLPMLKQSPNIIVEFIDSDRDPGGLGEIGVPALAPALANAVFTLTGRRLRQLPLSSKALA
jgi:isoquinoline 1-oxidoreductase beta subunit